MNPIEATVDAFRKYLAQVKEDLDAHKKYASYLFRHKKFVFYFGRKLKVGFFRLIFHDLTKFYPAEWFPYVDYFYGKKLPCCPICERPLEPSGGGDICGNAWCASYGHGTVDPVMLPPMAVRQAFAHAWKHHQTKNSHHWQYHLLMNDSPGKDWAAEARGLASNSYVLVYKPTKYEVAEFLAISHNRLEQDTKRVVGLLNRLPTPIEMPDIDVREMIADWCGASAANNGDIGAWYQRSKPYIILHPETRTKAEHYLQQVTYGSRP